MQTVGEILRNERINKGFTLKDIEKRIKVREKFLRAIEDNNWELFTSKIYIAGIIKNYASVLGLPAEKIQAIFRREYAKKEEITFRQKLSRGNVTPETKKYLTFIIVIVFFFFFLYFGYELKLYLTPPDVTIVAPTETTFKRQDRVRIIGKTEKEASITIFGERVFQNENGVFQYDFPLKPGKNTLVIEVTGANGKKTVIKKNFFLNP